MWDGCGAGVLIILLSARLSTRRYECDPFPRERNTMTEIGFSRAPARAQRGISLILPDKLKCVSFSLLKRFYHFLSVYPALSPTATVSDVRDRKQKTTNCTALLRIDLCIKLPLPRTATTKRRHHNDDRRERGRPLGPAQPGQ